MSSQVDRGKNLEVNDSPKSLEERLSNCLEPKRHPFIYRVHNSYLRDINDNAHEPCVVAIGPYHHGNQSLKIMEKHKLLYLKSLLVSEGHELDRYRSAIEEIEEEVRSYYAEELSFSSNELVDMLVLDGCFILELCWKSWKKNDQSCTSDPIFQMEWCQSHLIDDLVLFENQIPFLVLRKLHDLINRRDPILSQQALLMKPIFHFLVLKWTNYVENDNVKHLLHLKHATERPSSAIYTKLKPCPDKREFNWIPPATELKDANVTFRKHKRQVRKRKRQGGSSSSSSIPFEVDFSNGVLTMSTLTIHGGSSSSSSSSSSSIPFEVDFSNGVLTMSTLTIHDGTDRNLRNLILYEQYFPDNQPTYVTDYLVVLDYLVNTGRDVEILSQHGIVKNMTGHNQMAADIINRLAQSVMLSQTHFIYADTFKKINDHHKMRWHRARAALSRDYFNTPWAYISFVAALLLLLLTVAQTVFSAIQL